jgi:hypothetical protein
MASQWQETPQHWLNNMVLGFEKTNNEPCGHVCVHVLSAPAAAEGAGSHLLVSMLHTWPLAHVPPHGVLPTQRWLNHCVESGHVLLASGEAKPHVLRASIRGLSKHTSPRVQSVSLVQKASLPTITWHVPPGSQKVPGQQ